MGCEEKHRSLMGSEEKPGSCLLSPSSGRLSVPATARFLQPPSVCILPTPTVGRRLSGRTSDRATQGSPQSRRQGRDQARATAPTGGRDLPQPRARRPGQNPLIALKPHARSLRDERRLLSEGEHAKRKCNLSNSTEITWY